MRGLISMQGKTAIAVLLTGKTTPGEQLSLGNRISGVWTDNIQRNCCLIREHRQESRGSLQTE